MLLLPASFPSEAIDGSPGARILLELAKQQSCVCGDGGLLVLALGTQLVLQAQRDERSLSIKPAAAIEARARVSAGDRAVYAMRDRSWADTGIRRGSADGDSLPRLRRARGHANAVE